MNTHFLYRRLIFTLFLYFYGLAHNIVGHCGAQTKSIRSTSFLIVILPVKRRLGGNRCSAGSGGESRILHSSKFWLIRMSPIQFDLFCIFFVSHQSAASVLQYDQTGKGQADRCGGRSRRHPYRLAEHVSISPGTRRHSSENTVVPESHRLDAIIHRRRWVDHREFRIAVGHGALSFAPKTAEKASRYFRH